MPGLQGSARPIVGGTATNGIARSNQRDYPDEHDRVMEIQRARILAAMAEVSVERGPANVRVAHVVARAGVSRRTFYELFGDREECLRATLDDVLTRASEHVLQAYDPAARWKDRVRVALIAVLGFLDDEPGMGHLVLAELLGTGLTAVTPRRDVLATIVDVVDEGRGEVKGTLKPPRLIAEGVVGGVLSVLNSRLFGFQTHAADQDAGGAGHPERESLMELTGSLMAMIVLPYLGPVAARQEIKRPPPRPAIVRRPADRDPLRDLGMRLTYRTVRVLMAIAEHPQGSNHKIALAAGIEDQGQASKLLARLQRLGLIANVGAGHIRGAPNAWSLTETGHEINAAMAGQTARA